MKSLNILIMIPLLFAFGSISANEIDHFPDKVQAHLEGQLPKKPEKKTATLTPFEKKLLAELNQ
jgi:hypothetical protein